jgi:dephospho-CoA kinase
MTLDILGKQIEEKINACTGTPRFPGTSPTDASPPNDLLTNARLKKKEVQTKTSKRRRSWLDKKHKIRKKRQNQTTSQFREEVCCSIKIMFSILSICPSIFIIVQFDFITRYKRFRKRHGVIVHKLQMIVFVQAKRMNLKFAMAILASLNS